MTPPSGLARDRSMVDAASGRWTTFGTTAAIALAIVMHGMLVWITRARTIGTGNDDAAYLLLGRALQHGHYRELFYVGTPVHAQYPPGYPALLAMLGAPADGSIGIVIVANVVLSCVALILLHDVVRRWSPTLSVVVVTVTALNPAIITAASRVQSEPLFTCALMLSLWALRPSASGRMRWVAIASVVVAALTRSAGLSIVVGVLAHFLLRRDWSSAAWLVAISCLTIGPWLVWTMIAPEKIAGRSYIADATLNSASAPTSGGVVEDRRATPLLVTLARRIRNATQAYLTRRLPTQLAVPTIRNTIIDNLLWVVVMLAAAAAGAYAMWHRWRAALLAFGAYVVLLLVWPYAIGRFLTPMLPIFIAMMLLGAWRIGVRTVPRAAMAPALAMAGVLIFGGTRVDAAMIRAGGACVHIDPEESEGCGADAARYAATARALSERLPPGAPVFTVKEATFFYLTGRPVVSVYRAFDYDAAQLRDYLRSTRPAAIFLPHLKNEEAQLAPQLSGICEELTDAGGPTDRILILWPRPPRAGERNACDAIARWRATWEGQVPPRAAFRSARYRSYQDASNAGG